MGNAGINLLSAYLVRIGLTNSKSSMIMGLVKTAAIFGPIFAGMMVDRWGGKNTAVLGFLLTGIGFILLPLFGQWQMIALFGFLAFFGSSSSRVALRSLLVTLVPNESLKEAIGWTRAATNTGVTIAFLAAGYLASVNFDAVFLLDGSTSLLACLAFVLIFKETGRGCSFSIEKKDSIIKLADGKHPWFVNQGWRRVLLMPKFGIENIRVVKYSGVIFLHFLLYVLFDVSTPARYEKMFPLVGASDVAYSNIVNTILCAFFAVPAAKYLKPKLSWLLIGNVFITAGAVMSHFQPTQLSLVFGMMLYTFGEILFTSCSLYFLLQLTQKTNRPGFWYGLSAALYGSAQPLAGVLAFPLVVGQWGLQAYQWFLLLGATATGAVILLGEWAIGKD